MKCHLHHDLWSITIINNKGCLKDSANQFHNVSKEAFMKTVNPSLGLFYGFRIWSNKRESARIMEVGTRNMETLNRLYIWIFLFLNWILDS